MADDIAVRDEEPKFPVRWSRGNSRELVVAAMLLAIGFAVFFVKGFISSGEVVATLIPYLPQHGVLVWSSLGLALYVGIATFQQLHPLLTAQLGRPVGVAVDLISACFFVYAAAVVVAYAGNEIINDQKAAAEDHAGMVLLTFGSAWASYLLKTAIGRTLLLNYFSGFALASSIWVVVVSLLIATR
jgi:hypothetical protein